MDEKSGLKDSPLAKDFNFREIKRPFTIEDIKDIQAQFKALHQKRDKSERGKFIMGESQFYTYLTSGSFYGVERDTSQETEILTEDGKQGYNDLLLSTYQGWRKNLIKNKDKIVLIRPEVIRTLGDLTQLPNPSTAEEVRNLYADNPKLNSISAISYQDGVSKEYVTNPFLHIKGHRYNGYEYEQPKTEMRLYLNPPINETPKLAQEFIKIANERGIPYYFKLLDFALQEPSSEELKRVDRMIFYSDKENVAKIAGVLGEIKEQHPEWFANRFLPPMTAKIMDGVGATEEPSEYQNKNFSHMGEKFTSFSSVRAKFLEKLWMHTLKDIMLSHPDLKPRGGRSLKQIFNDFVSAEDKQYLDALWRNNLTPQPEERTAKIVLEKALSGIMEDVIPILESESLLLWINRGIQKIAPEFGINPKNLAFNK